MEANPQAELPGTYYGNGMHSWRMIYSCFIEGTVPAERFRLSCLLMICLPLEACRKAQKGVNTLLHSVTLGRIIAVPLVASFMLGKVSCRIQTEEAALSHLCRVLPKGYAVFIPKRSTCRRGSPDVEVVPRSRSWNATRSS